MPAIAAARRRLLAFVVGVCPLPSLAATPPTAPAGGGRAHLLVLDLRPTLGADPDLARLLTEMVVARLHEIGEHEIVSSNDITTLLGLEAQKQLVGCNDDSCLAELAGALDAEWLVSGTVSRLADRPVLTLKLLDTGTHRLTNQLAEDLPDDEAALASAMRSLTYRLLDRTPPVPETAWYARPWVWVVAGVIAAGAGVGVYFLARPESAPAANLGEVVLDAR
jgi:hypothetical protein